MILPILMVLMEVRKKLKAEFLKGTWYKHMFIYNCMLYVAVRYTTLCFVLLWGTIVVCFIHVWGTVLWFYFAVEYNI